MATPEAIHYIGCAKDISKSSRDRRKLGLDSTGNPVARKQALSGWKLAAAISLQLIQAIKKKLEKSIAKLFPCPVSNCRLFSVSYSSCLAATKLKPQTNGGGILPWPQISLVGVATLDKPMMGICG